MTEPIRVPEHPIKERWVEYDAMFFREGVDPAVRRRVRCVFYNGVMAVMSQLDDFKRACLNRWKEEGRGDYSDEEQDAYNRLMDRIMQEVQGAGDVTLPPFDADATPGLMDPDASPGLSATLLQHFGWYTEALAGFCEPPPEALDHARRAFYAGAWLVIATFVNLMPVDRAAQSNTRDAVQRWIAEAVGYSQEDARRRLGEGRKP